MLEDHSPISSAIGGRPQYDLRKEMVMTVLDIFSWLPAKEISLEDIEKTVLELYGTHTDRDGYSLKMELSEDADENVISVSEDLMDEGKQVCYLLKNNSIIAAIGYR